MLQKNTTHIVALDSSTPVCAVALLSIVGRHKRLHTRHWPDDVAGTQDNHGTATSSGHAERVLPMIQEVLDRAGVNRQQLTAVAFGQGPGAFTGLRVACGVAQGLAYGLGIPVVPVVSLHALAQSAAGGEAVRVVVQDARMGEVYAAAYAAPALAAGLLDDGLPAGGTDSGPDGENDRQPDCYPECYFEWHPLCAPVLLAADDLPQWLAQQAQTWPDADAAPRAVCLLGNACDSYPELRHISVAGMTLRWQALANAQQAGTQAAVIAQLALRRWQQGKALAPARAAPLYVRDKVAYTTAEREHGQGGNPRAETLQTSMTQTATRTPEPQLPLPAAAPAIFPMQADDLDTVLDIEQRTQMYPWTRGQIQDSLRAGCEGWVVRENGQVRGFCLLMKAPDVAHLLLLGVAPECQRRGLGHTLLRHCEGRTVQWALPAVLLEVRPSNRKALDFYTHRGFARIGVRKGYYPCGRDGREDAWVMQKILQQKPQRV